MRDLGRIARLQIQRSTLKTGEKPNRVYDPAPLLAVDRLSLGPDGALGLGPDGTWLVDVHHRAHPHTKNADGAHGVSIGFTEDIERGVVLVGSDGGELVRLEVLQFAEPCRPFSGWALGGVVESHVMKETLQFLEGGTRGYYCRGLGSGIVSVGDRMAVLERDG